jgi:hypothetical protein
MDATQKKGLPKQLRGRSLGTRLSEAEYAQCEKSAARRGQTLSEWCRQVLLDAATGPAQAPEAEVILSEILALRKIVINLLYGEKTGEPLSEERMRELIEAADSEKLAKAIERLRAVRTARDGASSDGDESVRKSPGDRAAAKGMAE